MPAEPGTRRAVVDRIVEGQALLLVEPGGEEHHLAADRLPSDAGEGTWVLVTGGGDDLAVVGTDPEAQAARQGDMDARVEHLRRTRRGGRFKR